MNSSLAGKTVLVTGATGCIGGRLVEYLCAVGARVRALVRNPARAVRIGRLPVELVVGDLLDIETVRLGCEKCEVVVHCAYGNEGDEATQRRVTEEGTANALEAALAAGVRRFVHLSTIAVHDADSCKEIDESAPYAARPADIYSQSKIEAERRVWAAHRAGLPATIARPTIVYGPYSLYWTVRVVERLRTATFYLIEDGLGTCQPIYVDDAARALMLMATRPEAVGEAFFLGGPPTTWREFYGYYMTMTRVPDVVSWKLDAWRKQRRLRQILATSWGKMLGYLAAPRMQKLLREFPALERASRLLAGLVPSGVRRKVEAYELELYQAMRHRVWLPSESEFSLFMSQTVYSTHKAETLLGFRPRSTLDEGMRHTQGWLHYMQML